MKEGIDPGSRPVGPFYFPPDSEGPLRLIYPAQGTLVFLMALTPLRWERRREEDRPVVGRVAFPPIQLIGIRYRPLAGCLSKLTVRLADWVIGIQVNWLTESEDRWGHSG